MSLEKISQLEGSLLSLYEHPVFLSPTWRVIYQEAVRGNHILFNSLPGFVRMESLTLSRLQIQELASNAMECRFSELLANNDLSEMTTMIRGLTAPQQKLMFDLYKRVIKRWTEQLKVSLN